MTTKQKITIAVVFIILASAYLGRDKIKNWLIPYKNNGGVNDSDDGKIILFSNKKDENKLLKKGVEGKEVEELQSILNEFNEADLSPLKPLALDGIFGSLTEEMLLRFMSKKSITLKEAKKYKPIKP